MDWSSALDIQLAIYEHHASPFGVRFAQGYFQKPADIDGLLSAIANALGVVPPPA